MAKDKRLEVFDGGRDGGDVTLYLIGYEGDDGKYVGQIEEEDQAKFIVEACNNHYRLKEELEQAQKKIKELEA